MSTIVDPGIRNVFDYFHNLNLLVLLDDLRQGRTAREAWFSGSWLCPVAHGLAEERQIRALCSVDQDGGLNRACDFAARQLGASPEVVIHFVQRWDSNRITDRALLLQLECLWAERLADAEMMQELLVGSGGRPVEFVEDADRSSVFV